MAVYTLVNHKMRRGYWFIAAALLGALKAVDGGIALHISDFHQDDQYSAEAGDITYYCHETGKGGKLGIYGDYNCDSPKV